MFVPAVLLKTIFGLTVQASTFVPQRADAETSNGSEPFGHLFCHPLRTAIATRQAASIWQLVVNVHVTCAVNFPVNESVEGTMAANLEALQCKLEMHVMESNQFRGIALGEQVRVAFQMSVLNPTKMPDSVEDYWRMELWQGSIPPYPFSGGLVESWPVYGTLDNLTISLVGFERRAGAMSDLQFDFIPSDRAASTRTCHYVPIAIP